MIVRKARSAMKDARNYVRFLGALPAFLRRRMSLDEANAIFHQRMANRGANFWSMVEGGVFAHLNSPYRALFEVARPCSPPTTEAFQ